MSRCSNLIDINCPHLDYKFISFESDQNSLIGVILSLFNESIPIKCRCNLLAVVLHLF